MHIFLISCKRNCYFSTRSLSLTHKPCILLLTLISLIREAGLRCNNNKERERKICVGEEENYRKFHTFIEGHFDAIALNKQTN